MFSVSATDGLARAGTLITRHTHMPTPAPLLYTRRGGCLYLSPDMLEKLRPQAQMLQINVMQFMSQPDAAKSLKLLGASLHHYLGVPSWGLFAVNRDPLMAEYSHKPATDKHVHAYIHSGSNQVSPSKYMDTIAAMEPEVYVALVDEVPAGAKRNAVIRSVDRTLKWLDECLQRHEQLPALQPQAAAPPAGTAAASTSDAAAAPCQPMILGPIVGSDQVEQRARSARAVAGLPVGGFALCGFGTGETQEQQKQLMRAAVEQLPPDKLRLVSGLASPDEVVQAVAEGVDVFDCTYPVHATLNGYVLSFPVTPEQEAEAEAAAGVPAPSAAEQAAAAGSSGVLEPLAAAMATPSGEGGDGAEEVAGSDGNKLNLWSPVYRLDKRPMVPGCSCWACQHHSRAYVHHLLLTREMLGSVLLEMHNTHWWLQFFGAMRAAIEAGRWKSWAAWWGDRQLRAWPEQ